MGGQRLTKNLFLTLIIIFGLSIRWFGINNGYWFDEWSSFYYSNPNLSINQIYSMVLSNEGAQPLYFIIASKWNYLFGYYPEVLRYFSFIIGILSIFLFLILLKEFSKDNYFIFFAIFLFSSNYFLIQFSQESRYYSLSLFFSLLNLIFFFRFLKKKKYFFFYILSSLLSILTNIFFVLIVFSQFFFLLSKKKKNIIYYVSIIIILILSAVANYQYVNSVLDKTLVFNIQKTINFNFLIGFYFNIYFGSVFLGGLIIVMILLSLRNIKIIINNNFLFCIISIIITYSLPAIYSLLKNPILRPRYIIFIVPIIILYFAYTVSQIDKKFIKKSIVTFFVLLSIVILIYSGPIIYKPETTTALNIIAQSGNKYIYAKKIGEKDYFYNYLTNLYLAKKLQIVFINKDKIQNKKFFWEICLNNPRFENNYKTDNQNCFLNAHSKSHKISKSERVPDYILVLFEKKI
jgi:uncharacterized membrane protein